MTGPKVLGVDPSVTCFGLAGDGWTDTIRPRTTRRKTESQVDFRHARMRHIREAFAEFLPGVQLVVIEGVAPGPGMDMDRQLAWLSWTVRDMCWSRGIPYAMVSPGGLKRYAVGAGRRSSRQKAADDHAGRSVKDPVLAAVSGWLGREVATSDEADAAVLHAMGRDWLGAPVVTVPRAQRVALDGVAWPDPQGVLEVAA